MDQPDFTCLLLITADNNVHLFAMTEKADANGESESSDEDEEAYNHNDKEAKVEAYEDVD